MAKRVIVDRIDGTTHIYSDNGGSTLHAHGTVVLEHAVHEIVTDIICEITGNVLTDLDVIEYTEIENGKEQPVQLIKMSEYLEK